MSEYEMKIEALIRCVGTEAYRTPRRRFDPSFYKKIRGDQ